MSKPRMLGMAGATPFARKLTIRQLLAPVPHLLQHEFLSKVTIGGVKQFIAQNHEKAISEDSIVIKTSKRKTVYIIW